MIEVALYEPEIPQNTGAIIRLCANMGTKLHLIEPLAFDLSEKKVRRAGLDYHELTNVIKYPNFDAFLEAMQGKKLFACTTKTTGFHSNASYTEDSVLLFGPETRGLPKEIIDSLPMDQRVRIPMVPDSRSLNLANSVSVIAYEAWRQLGYHGAQ